MKYSLQDLCNKIIAESNKPVLFLDTCVLLDVIRVSSRDGANVNTISTVNDLVNTDSMWLIISDVVNSEWLQNVDKVYSEADNHLKSLGKGLVQFQSALAQLPSLGTFSYTKRPHDYNIPSLLKDLSNQLREKALVIDFDTECAGKAMLRVVSNKAPSALGKDESKDCTIYEHYLELGKQLRAASFSNEIVFASSNKADFGEPEKLRAPIDSELSELNIRFVNSLPWALSLIQ
ncbi:PIN domain-containing protein [Vibrio cholerae]|uniref:PIN domain-containing protein n=1 Tax=Vibrio cholerae TaxID=666 RepID=UPI003967D479|nr:DUF4935 domain-containing protein [Vibrio cholerae]